VAKHNFQCAVGDRSTPLSVRCYDEGKDNNLTGLTVLFAMDETSGANKLAETSTGVSVQPTKAFTADTTSDWYVCNGHGMKDGWEVILSTSAADLPAPLSTTTRYFIVQSTPNYFRLATEPNGAAIVPTDTGTGTHSIAVVGQVQYAWTVSDVATAGTFKGWVIIQDSSSLDRTFPNTSEGIGIEIVGAN
jgi:hypothetical protein